MKEKKWGTKSRWYISEYKKRTMTPWYYSVNNLIDIFKKYGIMQWEIFQLSRTDDMEGFTNISQTISANPNEEEVWVELLSYRDKKHKD